MVRHLLVCVTALAVWGFFLVSMPVSTQGAEKTGAASIKVSSAEKDTEKAGVVRPNHRFFNLHFSAGGAFVVGDDVDDQGLGGNGGQGIVGMDFGLVEPLALSISGGYNGYARGDRSALKDLFVGMGFRLRFLVDRSGALTEDGGNAFGNLWLDAHLAYHSYESENHGGFNVGLGYEFSLASDFNLGPYLRFQYTPWGEGLTYMMFSVGLQVSLGGKFSSDDADDDGVSDSKDKCVKQQEDKDGFEDEDGCPDTDNDNDGILDVDDECPDLAGISGKKGCPEDDNDRDGIKNEVDKCKDEAEDEDGFEDEDGCPDTDNDKDGVLDEKDKCPNEVEDKDGFEDEDGCPDTDNDKDGILDANDKCPNEPENKNGKDDEDGCLDYVRIDGDAIKLLLKIEFQKNKDAILEKSYPVLEEVATILKLNKEMRVRIEGHVNDKNKTRKGVDLSEKRARSVRTFLVEKDVLEAQLMVEGIGGAKPIADSSTKDGRAQNERIEFHITAK